MKPRRLVLTLLSALALTSAGLAQAQAVLRIGFFPGPYADQFKRGVQPYLESQGIKVQATEFSNIIQLNTALMDGSLDANVFQNRAFMDSFNTQQKATLVEVLQVPSAPLGVYSAKHKDLKALLTAHKEIKEIKDIKVLMVYKAIKVFKEIKDFADILDH